MTSMEYQILSGPSFNIFYLSLPSLPSPALPVLIHSLPPHPNPFPPPLFLPLPPLEYLSNLSLTSKLRISRASSSVRSVLEQRGPSS